MLGDTQWHVTQKRAWLAYAEPTLEVCCLPAPRRSQTQGREDKEGSLDACVHACVRACVCVCRVSPVPRQLMEGAVVEGSPHDDTKAEQETSGPRRTQGKHEGRRGCAGTTAGW